MTKQRLNVNGDGAKDVLAALVSHVSGLRENASRLYADVDRLHRKINATHRAADRLHRKIEGTHARIRILRSKNRVRARKETQSVSANR